MIDFRLIGTFRMRVEDSGESIFTTEWQPFSKALDTWLFITLSSSARSVHVIAEQSFPDRLKTQHLPPDARPSRIRQVDMQELETHKLIVDEGEKHLRYKSGKPKDEKEQTNDD